MAQRVIRPKTTGLKRNAPDLRPKKIFLGITLRPIF
jgi:hypothetical protein